MVKAKKDSIKEENINKSNINTNVNDPNIEQLKNENQQLKSELDEIKKMLLNLNLNQNQSQVVAQKQTVIKNIEEDDPEIRQNKYIKVISLNFGKLVLSTEGRGQGKIFTFNKFGEVKNIIYSDLANLIHHQQSFAEQGRFYILDKQVVKNHGLVEYYDKLMTKEMIDNILNHNRDEIISLFTNATDAQKETIVNILIKKIVNGEDVDINKIDILSRIWGQNIYDIARDKIAEKEAV
jgi:hypothetical protein